MLENLRNIGIIAHVDAGKTTTTERILYFSGSKHKVGDVDDGNTTTDFDPLEKAKGITINSAAVTVEWGETRINLIDTPGHVDFTAEVERSLRVLDGGVCVFCAVGGVEVQSETVWFQANKHNVPRIAYINKLDRMGADFFDCIEQMKTKLQCIPAICAMPVGQSSEFKGVIDLVEMKFIQRDPTDKTNVRYTLVDIPESHKAEAKEYHEHLLEAASHADDQLVELILDEKPVPKELLKSAPAQGHHRGQADAGDLRFVEDVPRRAAAARRRGRLSAVAAGSAAGQRHRAEGQGEEAGRAQARRQGAVCGLAFKTVTEPTGDLVYVRIYSGELHPKDEVLNTTAATVRAHRPHLPHDGRPPRAARSGRPRRDRRRRRSQADLHRQHAVRARCARSCWRRSASPSRSSASRSSRTGRRTRRSWPTRWARWSATIRRCKSRTDPETKQLIISGMGELHLEVSVEKLMRNPGREGDGRQADGRVSADAEQDRSRSRRATSSRLAAAASSRSSTAASSRSPRSRSRSGTRWLEEEGEKPDPNNIYFQDKIVGGVVPKEYIPSVEAGFRDATVKGAKYGFQCVDMQCTLMDGKYHDVDQSQDAFKLAAMECTRDAHGQGRHHAAGADHERGGGGAGELPGRPGRRHQPPPRRDPELQQRQGPLPDCTPTSRWRNCSATPAICATPPAARRRSPWSRAITPRCVRNWRTCARRVDSSLDSGVRKKKQPSESSQRRRIAMAAVSSRYG